jgi:pimeloyl-ACP methyl ester carboxylesterase
MHETGRVHVGDVELAFERCGAGGRPFVLVHGFTGSRADWSGVLPALAALGETLALDQRGHGGSTNTRDPAGYQLDQLARDLEGFLAALGVERCDLLGHSMGGMVVLRLALARPERVASLVLMDTAARGVGYRAKELFEAGGRLARSQGMARLAQALRAGAAADPSRAPASLRMECELGADAYWGAIAAKLEAMDPEAFACLGPQIGEQEGVVARLGEIRVPTLVVVGEQDRPFLAASRELADGIPGARLAVIADAAHSPQVENRAAWLEAVSGHLAQARKEAEALRASRRRA